MSILRLDEGGIQPSELMVDFPSGAVVKNLPATAGVQKRRGFDSWVGKIPWSRKWQPIPVFLPGKLDGQRSLVGYSSLGRKELDTMEELSTHAGVDRAPDRVKLNRPRGQCGQLIAYTALYIAFGLEGKR